MEPTTSAERKPVVIPVRSLIRRPKPVPVDNRQVYRETMPDPIVPLTPKINTAAECLAWIEKAIHKMDAPFAYLGDEPNTWKKDWDAPENAETLKILLIGAMSYTSSEGNLAIPLIYSQLNHTVPQYITERCYFPNTRAELAMFKEEGVPFFSLENKRPLKDFDVLAFSVSYIMPYLHLALMLYQSGIAPYALDRKEDDPIIITGGCMSFVCEILGGGRGGVFDLAFIGDSEDGFETVLEDIRVARKAGVKRRDILLDLQRRYGERGVYVPQFYDVEYDSTTHEIVRRVALEEGIPVRITKAYVRDLNTGFIIKDPFVSFAGGMAMGQLEVARGCSSACLFCIGAGQLVETSRGPIPIENVRITDTVWDGHQWAKVTETMVTGRQKASKFTLQNGRTLVLTKEHHVWIFDDGVLVKKHVSEFSVGDTVLMDYHDKLSELPNNASAEELLKAEMVGYLVGDGSYREQTEAGSQWAKMVGLYFHKDESEMGVRYHELLSLFGVRYADRLKIRDVTQIQMCRPDGPDLLDKLELDWDGGRGNKKLPDWIMNGSKAIVEACLRALFDTDGTVGEGGKDMSFRTIGVKLSGQVAALLARLGYMSRIGTDAEGLRVFVTTHEGRMRFRDEIGLRAIKKMERLKVLEERPEGYQTGRNAPYVEGVEKLFEHFIQDKSLPKKLRNRINQAVHYGRGIFHRLYEDLIKYVTPDPYINAIFGNTFESVAITAIDEVEVDTYDLTVEPTHRLVVNGVVVGQCQEGHTYRPYRERSAAVAVPAMKELMENTGCVDVTPASFTSSDHHEINVMIKDLLENVTDRVNIISQRADAFSLDPTFAWLTGMGGSKTVSVGMEGISQRMRDIMSKAISEENLLGTVEFALKAGYQSIKFFMITNVPGTCDSDYEELLLFLDKVAVLRNNFNPRCEIKLSFTPLFLSAHTPFQWNKATIDDRTLTPWIPLIRQKGFGFRLGSGARFDEANLSQMFHLADRRITSIMVDDCLQNNYVHFGTTPKGTVQRWQAHFAKKNLSFEFYFQEKHEAWNFSWDFINVLASKESLLSEYKRSRQAMGHLEPCINECYQCGACDTDIWRQRKGWAKAKHEDAEAINVDKINIIRQKGLVQRARLRVQVDAKHRYVEKDHWRLQFRRAAYKTKVPLDRKTIAMASDQIKMMSWISGLDYIDIKLTEHVFDPKIFMSAQFNGWLQGVTVTDARIYDEMKGMRTIQDLCLYEMSTPKDLAWVESKIKWFMAQPICTDPIPNDDMTKGGTGKVDRKTKADFIKAHPTCGRIKRMGYMGVERVIVDFRSEVQDMWASKRPDGTVLIRILSRGEISPYDTHQLVLKSKWQPGVNLPAARLEYLLAEEELDQDDFLVPRCAHCDKNIEQNLFGVPVHADYCLKHQPWEDIYSLSTPQILSATG